MAIEFYYKGLSAEDMVFGQTPKSSAAKARGTLYEAWFDALQTSPWYRNIAETGEFPSVAARDTWNQFGELRNETFSKWWLKTGYRIFAERVPYRPIQELEGVDINIKSDKDDSQPPILRIEVPLNLHPRVLREQFAKILAAQEEYHSSFDRWDHSTAKVHQYRDAKLSYVAIKKWLDIYRLYEKEREFEGFKMYNFVREHKLHPSMFIGLNEEAILDEGLRVNASNVLSDLIKQAKNLMAHASEGRFPCTDPHPWAISGRREKLG